MATIKAIEEACPACIEVFGDDGELQWIESKSASQDAIEDAIKVLDDRVEAGRKDITALRRLLSVRQMANPDPVRAAREFRAPFDL